MSRSDDLHAAAFALTPLVLDKKYKHMRKPFEMVLGGLIVPALVEEDPKVLEEHPEFRKLLEQYTQEKVMEFFRPKPAPKAEKAPEALKVEPVSPAPEVAEKAPKLVTRLEIPKDCRIVAVLPPAEKVGGKYRRLKIAGMAKVRRFERDLEPNDRDYLIHWWNDNQRLVPDDDPVCVKMANEINAVNPTLKPLSPLQMAGYFSYLCRLGMWGEKERTTRIVRSIHKGRFTVHPVYGADLIKAIIDNYNAERADEALRREAHAKKMAARGTVVHKETTPVEVPKVVVEVEAKPTTPTPEPVEAVAPADTFEIKFAI